MLTDLFSYIYNNQYSNWAFSGIGLSVMSIIYWLIKKFTGRSDSAHNSEDGVNKNSSVITINNGYMNNNQENKTINNDDATLEQRQKKTHILFIDDKKFLVTDILISSGWLNTTSLKDVTSINQKEITTADIIFVDIQGVGIKMKFSEEGLGLAKALKEKYPNKRIIVYSAEQTGNRFHDTLKIVDDFLPKDADPYLFEEIIERFSLGE